MHTCSKNKRTESRPWNPVFKTPLITGTESEKDSRRFIWKRRKWREESKKTEDYGSPFPQCYYPLPRPSLLTLLQCKHYINFVSFLLNDNRFNKFHISIGSLIFRHHSDHHKENRYKGIYFSSTICLCQLAIHVII